MVMISRRIDVTYLLKTRWVGEKAKILAESTYKL